MLHSQVIPWPPNFDSSCLFCVSLTVENDGDTKTPSCFMYGVRLSSSRIPRSDPVAFRMLGVCVCCGNHNVGGKKAVLHLCFVVVFVVTLGCSLPLVHFQSWITPSKKQTNNKNPPQPLFFIYPLKASLLLPSLLMEITLSCLLQSRWTRDKNPSSVLGGGGGASVETL